MVLILDGHTDMSAQIFVWFPLFDLFMTFVSIESSQKSSLFSLHVRNVFLITIYCKDHGLNTKAGLRP